MKTNLFRFIPLLAIGLIYSSCQGKKDENVTVNEKIKVKVETAKLEKVQQTATFTANVEGEAVNQITPAIPARIKKIYVEVGDRVARGQKLAEMDNSNLNQQRVQLNNLEKDYQRYQELYQVGGVSQQQLDQLKVQLDVAKTAISNMQENTVLVSPISGIITDRNYDNGDVFAQMPILTVQQLNPVKALINVSESYFPQVKTGMPVDIKLDVYGEENFQGKVKLIHPTIDPNSHTFVCEIEINNPELRVRPGMFARVTMNFGESERVVVPDLAIVKQSGSNDRFTFIFSGGKVSYSKVEVGQRLNDKWEIISGINPGDEIITAGQTRLINGSEVEIVKD